MLLNCYVTLYHNFCIRFNILNTNYLIIEHVMNSVGDMCVCAENKCLRYELFPSVWH